METKNEFYSYWKETDKNKKDTEYIPPKITKKEEKIPSITGYDERPKNHKKLNQEENLKLIDLNTSRDEKLLEVDLLEKKLEIINQDIEIAINNPFTFFKEIIVWSKKYQRDKIIKEIEQLKKDIKGISDKINKIIN